MKETVRICDVCKKNIESELEGYVITYLTTDQSGDLKHNKDICSNECLLQVPEKRRSFWSIGW